jgi:hypothetical protein
MRSENVPVFIIIQGHLWCVKSWLAPLGEGPTQVALVHEAQLCRQSDLLHYDILQVNAESVAVDVTPRLIASRGEQRDIMSERGLRGRQALAVKCTRPRWQSVVMHVERRAASSEMRNGGTGMTGWRESRLTTVALTVSGCRVGGGGHCLL